MYESYLPMTPKELHLHLRKRKLHPVRIAQIEDDVARIKEINRVDRITYTVRKQAWQDLIAPLRTELDNARVGRKYQTGVPEADELRREAFDAYIAVLEKLSERLSWPAKMLECMPTQWAEQLNAEKKGSPITNGGVHWTDWIPPRIKNAVSAAFAELPTKPRAKRKVPFQRVIPPSQHAKRKATLIKRTLSDLAVIERKWKLNPTEENADLYTNVTQALRAIEQTKPNDLLPATWHGMLKL